MQNGVAIFQHQCILCHGESGQEGVVGAGDSLSGKCNDGKLRQGVGPTCTIDDLGRWLAGPKPPMPTLSLKHEERSAVAKYVLTIEKSQPWPYIPKFVAFYAVVLCVVITMGGALMFAQDNPPIFSALSLFALNWALLAPYYGSTNPSELLPAFGSYLLVAVGAALHWNFTHTGNEKPAWRAPHPHAGWTELAESFISLLRTIPYVIWATGLLVSIVTLPYLLPGEMTPLGKLQFNLNPVDDLSTLGDLWAPRSIIRQSPFIKTTNHTGPKTYVSRQIS